MGLRQPDTCLCFGGRCWKQHCPNRKKPFNDPYDKPRARGTVYRPRPQRVFTEKKLVVVSGQRTRMRESGQDCSVSYPILPSHPAKAEENTDE